MMNAYAVRDRRLVELHHTEPGGLAGVVWIDLADPTVDEESAVVARFGQILAADAGVGEIEATSRYYEDEESIQVQLNFLDHTEDRVQNTNVCFAWHQGPLMSLHDSELLATRLFQQRAGAQPELVTDGMAVFLGILETKADHLADVLEETYRRLDRVSRTVLDEADPDLEMGLVALAEVEDRNGKVRINLMDTQRVLTSLLRSGKLETARSRLADVLRDVDSLLSHTAFLLEEISFLSNTIMGLINIEQNQIVKVLSVVATVFLPPTLVASLYGMNFRHMPELSWAVGYPLALLLMAALGIAPYIYARRRGWM